jgi:hypothetical protein
VRDAEFETRDRIRRLVARTTVVYDVVVVKGLLLIVVGVLLCMSGADGTRVLRGTSSSGPVVIIGLVVAAMGVVRVVAAIPVRETGHRPWGEGNPFIDWMRRRIDPAKTAGTSAPVASFAVAEESPSPRGALVREAFERGDYPKCTALFDAWKRSADADELAGTLLPNLLTIIALQRLGAHADAERLGRECVTTRVSVAVAMPVAAPLLSGEADLVRLTLGIADIGPVLDAIDDDGFRSRAYFYAGARSATLGNVEDSRRLLDRCLALPADTEERALAAVELRRVERST